jgi:phosphohistidine phosphatase
MSRELLILRHGKSDWGSDAPDFERPLKERGKRGARQAGSWLLLQDLVPDHLVSSPARRAESTAVRVCKAMNLSPKAIHLDPRVYEAGVPVLLRVIADCPPRARRMMLVGHNPGLEELLMYLCGERIDMPEDGKLLPTATIARVEMPDDWHGLKPGCATLAQIRRPGSE